MMKKTAIKSKFWAIYGIVFACLLVLIAVFFGIFFRIMEKFEESQPTTEANAFLQSITEEDLEELIKNAASDCTSFYTDRESVILALREKLKNRDLTVKKDYKNYTSESPVFTVSSGDVLLYRITLAKGNEIGYGFTAWKTEKTEPLLSVDILEPKSAVVCVPKGAVLFVNGMEVTESPTDTGIYRYVSKWEAVTSLESEYYTVPLLSDAAFTCTLDGAVCERKEEADGIYFLYPELYFESYTIEVPKGAAVTVNGILLDDGDIAEGDIPYTYSEQETGMENLPTAVRYELFGLSSEPSVTAELEGISLLLTREENCFFSGYPEELMYSCSIRVPAGSVVTLNGTVCSDEHITAWESESAELFAYSNTAPSYAIYTVDKLFSAPSNIKVMYHETALPCTVSANGRAYTASATLPLLAEPQTEELALRFLKDYFVYTSNGSSNTYTNLAKVLTYIPYGCTLYAKMNQSLNGFTWTSPVLSMSYNELEVMGVYACPDNFRLCEVAFDITQNFYGGIIREYRGTMKVLVTEYGQVVGMEINTNG